jgi:hypothetical protein
MWNIGGEKSWGNAEKFGRTRIKRELWVILTSGVIVQ